MHAPLDPSEVARILAEVATHAETADALLRPHARKMTSSRFQVSSIQVAAHLAAYALSGVPDAVALQIVRDAIGAFVETPQAWSARSLSTAIREADVRYGEIQAARTVAAWVGRPDADTGSSDAGPPKP